MADELAARWLTSLPVLKKEQHRLDEMLADICQRLDACRAGRDVLVTAHDRRQPTKDAWLDAADVERR